MNSNNIKSQREVKELSAELAFAAVTAIAAAPQAGRTIRQIVDFVKGEK